MDQEQVLQDLRTPLAVIRGMAEIGLSRRGALCEEDKLEVLRLIIHEVDRITQMIAPACNERQGF